jgi:hypothetical protein
MCRYISTRLDIDIDISRSIYFDLYIPIYINLFMSIYPYRHISIYLYIYIDICRYISKYLERCLSIRQSIHIDMSRTIHIDVSRSIHVSISQSYISMYPNLFVGMCVCLCGWNFWKEVKLCVGRRFYKFLYHGFNHLCKESGRICSSQNFQCIEYIDPLKWKLM